MVLKDCIFVSTLQLLLRFMDRKSTNIICLRTINFDYNAFWNLIVTMVNTEASFPVFICSYIVAW